jgi:hypothetical protein
MSRRIKLWITTTLALASVAALVTAGCGSDQSIVGGSCAQGYVQCGLQCVDPQADPRNCGSCGNACPAGVSCALGVCGSVASDSATDGAGDASYLPDVLEPDCRVENCATLDGPSRDALEGGGLPGDGTLRDVIGGDTAASDSTPGDARGADSGTDTGGNPCVPPTIACGGICLDPTSDPSNCGGCGVTCFSGICQSSRCLDATNGAIVFVGHDYQGGASAAQARVLSNAVLLPQNMQTVRVMAYERYASPAAVANIKSIITMAAMQAGRAVALTETSTDTDIPTGLAIAKFSVLLVPDQPKANQGDLAALGGSWQPTLATFTQAGGVVVVLDGDRGVGEMPQFTTATGLLSVSGQAPVATGTRLHVAFPADAVAVGVGTTYAAGTSSASIATEPSSGNVVYVVETPATDASMGLPVVVHKVF